MTRPPDESAAALASIGRTGDRSRIHPSGDGADTRAYVSLAWYSRADVHAWLTAEVEDALRDAEARADPLAVRLFRAERDRRMAWVFGARGWRRLRGWQT